MITEQKIFNWIDKELSEGRNDTVHDFLAYLAEQMIELNKAKNKEIKGFLKWLEREIGAEINNLTNKTSIKEYHEHSFEHLLDVLKRNKNKLSIDPSSRKAQELLEKHFTKSMSVLKPLKEKVQATDNLIDKIVYRLYVLTEDEIMIVEGRAENEIMTTKYQKNHEVIYAMKAGDCLVRHGMLRLHLMRPVGQI